MLSVKGLLKFLITQRCTVSITIIKTFDLIDPNYLVRHFETAVIFQMLGTPSESIWPGYNELPAVQKMTFAEHPAGGLRQRIGQDLLSETGLSLLQGFLTYNPARRLTADTALEHAYFKVCKL